MNKLFSTFLLLILSLFLSSSAHAADSFSLTHIGGLATNGLKYNQWWYEPQRVVLKGTAPKESNIALTFDNKTETIKVDGNGNWTFDMGTLEIADHAVSLTLDSTRYSFVLSIGSSPPADMSGTKGGLPSAGQVAPFIGLLALASLLIFYSLRKERV